MPRSRSQVPKPDPGLFVDEPGLVTSIPEGTDPETLPFQEFSDQDVNLEKWDQPPLTKDRSASIQVKIQFEDPQEVRLPSGITAHQWKRCSEIYTNVNFVVFTPLSEYPDLITPNNHLLNSEFYRNFISSIETLLYIGCTKPFHQEYGSAAFATVGNRPWRPWHHIYSCCKVNKGEHSPLHNPAGKYIVRLFWLGTWRKIYVDDLLPVDSFGNVLVPTIHKPKLATQQSTENVHKPAKDSKGKSKGGSPVRKETIPLWPMILSKALLKIASLTSCLDTANDFDIIHQLTGWIPQRIKTKDISPGDLWDIFTAYVDRFEWDENKEGGERKPKTVKTKAKEKRAVDAPKKGAKGLIPSGVENMLDGNRFVVVSCNNFEVTEDGEQPKTGDVPVFVSQVRDIPIIQPPPRPELEFWKTFRYEKWAVERGIIPPDIKKLNIKSLKIIDPFSRTLQGAKDGSQAIDANATQDFENIDKKSEKSSKSSKKAPKTKTAHLQPDPSTWLDFNDIQALISHINIYFEPRSFKSKIKISDINFSYKTSDFHHVISPIVFKESRNEPIYLFMDSIDRKLLMLNLSQMGDPNIFQKVSASAEEEVEIREESMDHDICEEIVLEKTKAEDKSKTTLEVGKKFSACKLSRQPISLVLEEYAWNCNSIGPPKATINTFGSKSVIIDLKPGRTSFRLWLSSHLPYVLLVLSDTVATVGCLEIYLAACGEESQLLTHLCYEVSSCYGHLVQSFGMPEYAQNLRKFYMSYKPSTRKLSKRELSTMHRIFFEEFCRTVTENYVSFNAVECLKLLFLQLKSFDYSSPYMEEPHLYPEKFELDEQVEYAKLMQRAAVKVQAFFKSIYIRSLLGKMKENHREYYGIFDVLKKVYMEIFSSGKRLNYCPTLIRKFFERKEMEGLNGKFEIFQDIQSVLDLQVYNGTLTVQELSWVPICRYEFYINSHEPVDIKVYFFCTLKTYSIRVFDNDTLEEVKHIGHDVIAQPYYNNTNGYTALCHGWSGEDTKVTWKFILATQKMSRNDVVLIPTLAMTTQTLKDHYVPNTDDIICRQIVRVGSNSFLTANLTSSYEHARLCLRLLDEQGKLIRQAYGVKNVLFPLVLLKWDEKTSDTMIHEQTQGSKKRVTTASGFSDITYSKLHRKHTHSDMDSDTSSLSKKISFTSSDSNSRKHKRKGSDNSDEISFGSMHSDDSESRPHRKKSQVRILPKGSVSSKTRTGSRAVALKYLNKVLENVQTHYILEAKVIDDSWPLTADEWNRVQKLKEKSYLNLLEERRSSTKRQTTPKKASLTLDEPYWTLDLMYVSGSALDFEPDTSQSEFRKQMKMKWFSDVERYRKGIQLREDYLQENCIMKVQSESQIDRSIRSNNPKDFTTKIFKQESLEPYLTKPLEEIDEDFCKTKSSDDYIIDEANTEHVIKQYEADEEAIQEDILGYITTQAENFEVQSKWFQEIKEDSQEELLGALIAERDYVKKVLQASSKSKNEKKGKGKKKK